ncbi:hypothetical protein [Sulfolobus sp. S-194]|uniref:hypothetical protein n=1 Tax=Sulfolobus sp. S-194 TaxID=2512240 RepID=UPI002570DDDA|nr:hypothetical protein [Sulfolobus sp. S-194]
MTRLEIVENLIKQIVALGLELVALDAGFYSVDVINYLSASPLEYPWKRLEYIEILTGITLQMVRRQLLG